MSESDSILTLNPRYGGAYGSAQSAMMDRKSFGPVMREVCSWPGYAQTPLVALPGLARQCSLQALWCKAEGARFGLGSFKPLGATYAMLTLLKGEVQRISGAAVSTAGLLAGRHREILAGITVACATSGNHGRALAWGAQLFGCNCVITMTDGVGEGRERAISAYGAEVVRIKGSFSKAVSAAQEMASKQGQFIISDTKLPGYPDIPLDIMRGYAIVAEEMEQQRGEDPAFTHVFVPGGGGRIAAAICGNLWERHGANRPKVVVVEPVSSDCLGRSARTGTLSAGGLGPSVMDGLVVERPSPDVWAMLAEGAFAFLAVADAWAIQAMRGAAKGTEGDPPLVIGDTGSAAWAGLLAAVADPAIHEKLALNSQSRVVLVATENATDPAVYERLTGFPPESVDGLKSFSAP